MQCATNSVAHEICDNAKFGFNCHVLQAFCDCAPAHAGLHQINRLLQHGLRVGNHGANFWRNISHAHRHGGVGAPLAVAHATINLHNIAVANHATAWNAVHHFIVHANARACWKRLARVGFSVANKRGFSAVGGNHAGNHAIQTCGGSSSHARDSGRTQRDSRNATRLRHVLNFLSGARFTCSAASWSQIARVIIWTHCNCASDKLGPPRWLGRCELRF